MRSSFFLTILCVFSLWTTAQCNGQTTQNADAPSQVTASSGVRPPSGSELVIKTSSGELIPVSRLLGDRVVDEILERAGEQRSIPRYSIVQMELDGSIDREKIRLEIELKVHVDPESEWVSVPLSIGDVYVESFESTSDIPTNRALLTTREQNTRVWHLWGKGLHTLRMQLVGRSRAISPGLFQMNLNLPPAAASQARLAFSTPVEIQKLPAGVVDEVSRDETGVKALKLWGLPSTFSLNWSDVVIRVSQKPVIQVQNRMKLDLTTIPVTLSCTQVLEISGGQINDAKILFPEGFELVEVDARNSAGVSILSNFELSKATSHSPAVVRFTSAMEGTITLSHDLELVNRQFPQDIRVTLPAILDVNQQPGDLEILFPTGLLVRQTELKGVQRIRVSSETDLSVAATAFRMRSPESQIVLHVEETEAQFAVSPEVTLEPDSQNVLATVRYPVSILKGSLLDFSIQWPGFSSGDWQIIPGTTRLISEKANLPLTIQSSESEDDLLKLTFPERQSGEFVVEFRAFASLDGVKSGAVQFRCPEVSSRTGQPFILTTIESDAYSMRPVSMGTGELLPTVPVSGRSMSGRANSRLKSESWLHDSTAFPVRLELQNQAPSVNAEIVLGLQPRETGIEVRETIHFEIEHRDLQGFSLQVPPGLRPAVRVAGTAEPLRASIESSNWSFRLPEAKRGSIAVEVFYLWPVDADATQQDDHVLNLPVILPQASKIRSVQAGTSALSGIQAGIGTEWAPVYSPQFDAAMETQSPAALVPLRWQNRFAEAFQASPDLIMIRSQVVGGTMLTSTTALYEQPPEFLSIETPDDLLIESIRVDNLPVSSASSDSASMYYQRINERGLSRWTIAAKKLHAGRKTPLVLECRVKEKLQASTGISMEAFFRRASIAGENPAVPVLWFLGTQGDYQVLNASGGFTRLTVAASGMSFGLSRTSTLRDHQMDAVLSSYSDDLQVIAKDMADRWASQNMNQSLFFGSAESGSLRIYLIPGVALLLVSALTCVLFFAGTAVFRQAGVVMPMILFCSALLVLWLIFPEPTIVVLPYAGMGIVFGVISTFFQKISATRQPRSSLAPRNPGGATVFGFSAVLSPALTSSNDSAAKLSGSASNVPAGSVR